jgi:phospholipase A-2-activating protein
MPLVSFNPHTSKQVLDLARLIVAFCPEAVKAPGLKERLFECLFKAADWQTPWVKSATKPVEMNVMLVFRALANVAQEGSGAADGPWLGQVCLYLPFINVRVSDDHACIRS